MRWKIKPISKSISNLDERVTELDGNYTSITPDLRNKTVYTGDVHSVDPGWYRVVGSAGNLPVSAAGYLLSVVRANDAQYLQYITDSGRTFTQTYNSVSWTDWEEVALNSKIATLSNGSVSIASEYSSNISNNGIRYVKRNDGVCVICGQFNISSDISSSQRTPIFEGLPRSSFTYPVDPVWIFAINNTTNKSYRIALNVQNGTLDEFYTAIPSGDYQLSPCTYLT